MLKQWTVKNKSQFSQELQVGVLEIHQTGRETCIKERDFPMFNNLSKSPGRVSKTQARMGQCWKAPKLDL